MFYRSLIQPLLFRLNAENVHERTKRLAMQAGRSELFSSVIQELYYFQSPFLTQHILGLVFPNPVGLAAGFDKNGQIVPAMQSLGMGFAEVGSVTARSSRGNPKPRLFRLPQDRAIINRMGLGNQGARRVVRRLQTTDYSIPVGLNIAKTPDDTITGNAAIRDYLASYLEAQKVADYITLNISCPNTGDGKTFEEPKALDSLLTVLLKARRTVKIPTLIKISSDVSPAGLRALVQVAEAHHIDGYVACNTSTDRARLQTSTARLDAIGRGGLSGAPLAAKSIQQVGSLRALIGPEKPIIGVGGIHNFTTALAMLQAGANLLQIYTGLVFEGPGLVKRINQSLAAYIKREKLRSISEIGEKRD